MFRLGSRNRAAVIAGLAMLLIFNAAVLLLPDGWLEVVRENAFDVVLAADRDLSGIPRPPAGTKVVVVDIDRRSLEMTGPWPWPREKMAELTEVIMAAKPAVVAFDILFSEPDNRSPAALARQLANLTGRADIAGLSATLPDGDQRLANALGKAPAVLGFVLDPEQQGSVPAPPILVHGPLPLHSLWQGVGALGPPPALAKDLAGVGALSLPANADGVVRRVPLFVGAAEHILPGLALETIRVLRHASDFSMQSTPASLGVGDIRLPLAADGMLRLLPVDQAAHADRTIPAVDVLRDAVGKQRLAGAIVVLGGSAPELGGLRKTPSDPLTPDAQIQADAVDDGKSCDPVMVRRARRPARQNLNNGISLNLGVRRQGIAWRLA